VAQGLVNPDVNAGMDADYYVNVNVKAHVQSIVGEEGSIASASSPPDNRTEFWL